MRSFKLSTLVCSVLSKGEEAHIGEDRSMLLSEKNDESNLVSELFVICELVSPLTRIGSGVLIDEGTDGNEELEEDIQNLILLGSGVLIDDGTDGKVENVGTEELLLRIEFDNTEKRLSQLVVMGGLNRTAE